MQQWTKAISGASVALLLCSAARAALLFNFTPQVGMDPQAVSAFIAAGQRWSSYFNNDMTVNVGIGLSSISGATIAQTTTANVNSTYSAVRAAMIAGASSADDLSATSHLQPGTDFSFLTDDFATGNVIVDNNASNDNTLMKLTRANAKALGLVSGSTTNIDATITFNSTLTSNGVLVPYDYDPSDGIAANAVDFTGVATHEIGHALGFISGVDTVDNDSAPRGFPTDFDGLRIFEPIDLFRYSSQSTAMGLLDESTVDMAYFSLDGGATNLGLFSQGVLNGDGFQASHWKHLSGQGIMDPTFSRGQLRDIKPLDVQAFDVIGYTLVPEPASIAVMGLAMIGLVQRSRRA
jgi:hypothetical protein